MIQRLDDPPLVFSIRQKATVATAQSHVVADEQRWIMICMNQ